MIQYDHYGIEDPAIAIRNFHGYPNVPFGDENRQYVSTVDD